MIEITTWRQNEEWNVRKNLVSRVLLFMRAGLWNIRYIWIIESCSILKLVNDAARHAPLYLSPSVDACTRRPRLYDLITRQ